MKSKLLVAALAALALSACTTTNPYTGQSELNKTTGGALLGAGGGAVAGAVIGAATGGDAAVGALIGAGVGGLAGAGIGSYMDQQEAEPPPGNANAQLGRIHPGVHALQWGQTPRLDLTAFPQPCARGV